MSHILKNNGFLAILKGNVFVVNDASNHLLAGYTPIRTHPVYKLSSRTLILKATRAEEHTDNICYS